ncbi:MAG: dTMP kinase [Thermoflexales bacterium]|nr:dTMP kinase [Thermoflexales bacterium]
MFITLEGLDGSGKTTQFTLLVEWLRGHGRDVLALREPGGTEIGERVREVLHDHKHADMDARAELLLYCASRAQLVAARILPHLASGGVVICDRFADSTLAYQGYGRGLEIGFLRQLLDFATRGRWPDLTLFFDIDAATSLQRRAGGGEWNRMDAESEAFYRRVEAGYRALMAGDPARWARIDAAQSREAVQAAIRARINQALVASGR